MGKAGRKAGAKKILVVDDHPFVRAGIRMLVADAPDLEISGEADSPATALAAIEEDAPDLAIIDLALKDGSGFDLMKEIRARHPEVLMLVLSMQDETFYAERVLAAGARGYIPKESGTAVILEGMRKVLAGGLFVSDALASRVIKKYVRGETGTGDPVAENLTARELEVFELIGEGYPTRRIADELDISVKTVEAHAAHIKDKLQLVNATELMKYAMQWKSFRREV